MRDFFRFARWHVSTRIIEVGIYLSGHGVFARAKSSKAKAFATKKRNQKHGQGKDLVRSNDAVMQGPLPERQPSVSLDKYDCIRVAAQARHDFDSAVWLAEKEIPQLRSTRRKLEKKSEKVHSHLMALAAKTPKTAKGGIALEKDLQATNKQFKDLVKRLLNVEVDLGNRKASMSRHMKHFCEMQQRASDLFGNPYFPDQIAPPLQQAPGQQDVRINRSVMNDKHNGRRRDSNRNRDISIAQRQRGKDLAWRPPTKKYDKTPDSIRRMTPRRAMNRLGYTAL